MYFGDVHTPWALQTVVNELLSNVLDRHLAGEAGRIDLELGPDGHLVVDDDGPGIEIAPTTDGIPFLEWMMTTPSYAPTRDGHRPHIHLGAGIGLAPICAASTHVVVDVFRPDGHYRAEFSHGGTVEPVRRLGDTERRGTRVDVRLDPAVVRCLEWPTAAIEEQLRILPSLCPGLSTSLRIHERFGPEADLGALVERVHARSRGPHASMRLHASPIVGCTVEPEGRADVALLWDDSPWHAEPLIESFCNFKPTRDGGTHVLGLVRGVVDATKTQDARGLLRGARTRPFEVLGRGLSAAVAISFVEPEFSGPTRDKLRSPEATRLVRRATVGALGAALGREDRLREALLGRLRELRRRRR